MYKVDLHTHSKASPDGFLSVSDYERMLTTKRLDVIAVTDHDTITFAQQLHEHLGDSIIVGEEITALEGELIGLFLHDAVPPGLSATETAKRIHDQGGLVYVPHPFETARKGIRLDVLDQLAGQVDIVETYNGRTLQDHGTQAAAWAKAHHVPGASSSDAHGRRGWGNTHSTVSEHPTRDTLMTLLWDARLTTKSTGVVGRLYPKLNRLRKHRA